MSKNERTPRTLAECSFVTGYAMADPPRRASWGIKVVCFAAFALIGVLLSFGV